VTARRQSLLSDVSPNECALTRQNCGSGCVPQCVRKRGASGIRCSRRPGILVTTPSRARFCSAWPRRARLVRASQRDPAPSAGMRERFLPECTFRGRETASSSSPCWQWRLCVAEPILVVSERGVGKHAGNIFSKLGLAPSAADHRRMLVGSPLPGALTGDTVGTISLTMPARLCSATAPRWRAACRCLPVWAAGGSAGSRVFRAALRS